MRSSLPGIIIIIIGRTGAGAKVWLISRGGLLRLIQP